MFSLSEFLSTDPHLFLACKCPLPTLYSELSSVSLVLQISLQQFLHLTPLSSPWIKSSLLCFNKYHWLFFLSHCLKPGEDLKDRVLGEEGLCLRKHWGRKVRHVQGWLHWDDQGNHDRQASCSTYTSWGQKTGGTDSLQEPWATHVVKY